MPELAEVEFYRRVWAVGLGDVVTSIDLHPQARVFRGTEPDSLRPLAGSTFSSALAHGKQLLFGFQGAGWLGVHLGMSGALSIAPPEHLADRHDHLVLRTGTQSLVFRDPRMFGRVRFDLGSEPPEWWTSQPAQVLSQAFNRKRFAQFLERRQGTPLKALLLDQSLFPGIGNWMADEILWRARLHPAKLPNQLSKCETSRLWRITREVARDALRVIAPDWGEAPDDWLFNHRWKAGGICPRPHCRCPLARAELRGRTSCWCPQCQDLASS